MAELKPRLIITSPGRKRRGFGTLFMVLIIFALGFYAGSKYGDYILGTEPSELNTANGNDTGSEDNNAISKEAYSGDDNTGAFSNQRPSESKKHFDLGGANNYQESDNSANVYGNNEDKSSIFFNNDGVFTDTQSISLNSSPVEDSFQEPDTPSEDTVDLAKGSYTLQVGAFATPEEAKGVADGYINKGYEAYIVPIENSRGEKWNLVKIGRFNTIDQAWSYSSYFKNREGIEAYVESVDRGTVFNESWSQE